VIATQRGVVLSPHDDGDILKSDFARLDAASDLQATADLLAVVGSYFARLDAASDLQATADLLAVVGSYFASLDAAFNLHASDRLVVLQLHSASFYVCLDSHLATLLLLYLGEVQLILVKFKLRPAFTFVLVLILVTSLWF